MTKSVLFAFVLFCIAAGACAQQDRPREEHVKKQDEPQQRRAAVRAALALRDQKGDAAEEPNKPRRQLTAQERQELRRQLRQQRNDSARP